MTKVSANERGGENKWGRALLMEVLEQALGRVGLLHMRQALWHDGTGVRFHGICAEG